MSYVDLLRSEGEVYLKQLCEVGSAAKATNDTPVTHGFFSMGTVVDQAKQDYVLDFKTRK